MDLRFTVAGLLIGMLVGLTGMGGGSLMTPLLILVLGVQPTIAVGSDLAYSAITKIVGGIQHNQQKTVDHKLALRMACGSVPGSLLGVWCIHRTQHVLGPGIQHLTVRLLGFMLILVSVAMIVKSHPRAANWNLKIELTDKLHRIWSVGSGAILGFLVGVTSVGSGTLFGILMLCVFGLGAKEMVGTDIFHAALLTSAAAIGHILAGNVNYVLVGSLLIGSIPGVLIGSRASSKLPDRVLRPVLVGVLLLSGFKNDLTYSMGPHHARVWRLPLAQAPSDCASKSGDRTDSDTPPNQKIDADVIPTPFCGGGIGGNMRGLRSV